MQATTDPAPTRRDRLRTAGQKAGSRARRGVLGLLMKLPGGQSSPESLLARFPDSALMPLRRDGLDPVPELGAIRATDPVSRLKMPLGLRGWLVTGYEESREVLAADASIFSNDFGHMIGKVGIAAEDDPGGLGFADPPAHTRLRRMLQPHFTVRALAARAERIEQIIGESLDELAAAGADGGPVDLQRYFSLTIPSRTIMELIGVDEDKRDEFARLSAARFDFSHGTVGSFDPILEAIELLKVVVARQRLYPGPGLIGQILTEHGDSVSDHELAGLMDGVLTGGLETTVSMLSLGAIAVLRDPSLADVARAGDERIDAFVEELLRYLTVVQVGFPRFAVRDVVVGGKQLFAGDVVLPSLSGANRDTVLGARMDQIDLDRPVNSSHLAFGYGLHRCVGAELARLELRMAYPALLRRFPNLALAVPEAELAYRKLSFVYGVDSLPVLLG